MSNEFFNNLSKSVGLICYGLKRGIKKIKALRLPKIIYLAIFTIVIACYFLFWKTEYWELSQLEILNYFLPKWLSYSGLVLELTLITVFMFGLKDLLAILKWQSNLNLLGLQNFEGQKPVVLDAKTDNSTGRIILKIFNKGIGVERYKSKTSDLESCFNLSIDKITEGSSPGIVEITLLKFRLPSFVSFSDFVLDEKPHLSFPLGQSTSGLCFESLKNLPHLLIAGTTGGGKSVFFKQMLYSLIRTTPRLKLYLIDLKGGLEMETFSGIPNVQIASTEFQAVAFLTEVENIMTARFKQLKKLNHKEFDPAEHNGDYIVVGVDEASVLYTVPKIKDLNTKNQIEVCRNLTDKIAKLGRAAGIHLILATQKVSKETIDTKVQENIGGRICFRMNTLPGSLTVLGNKLAYELPDIKGRAIWSRGHDFIEIQAPYLLDRELEELANELKEKDA